MNDLSAFHSVEFPAFYFYMFHEQLPLPVPCYDLVPVIELTLGPLMRDFGYSQLP